MKLCDMSRGREGHDVSSLNYQMIEKNKPQISFTFLFTKRKRVTHAF